MTTALELLAVAVIVAANGFFVAAEYGLVTVRRTRMQELDAQGSRRARQVLRLLDVPPRFISAIQLGVTLSSLALGAIGEPVVSELLQRPLDLLPQSWHTSIATTISVILAFTILTYFHVVMGEIVPKSYTLQHPERVALLAAGPINAFHAIFRPFIWVLIRYKRMGAELVRRDRVERRHARPLRGGAEDAREREPREGGARGGGAGHAPQGVRVRRQGRGRRDGAAPRRRRVQVDLPVEEILRLVLSHPFTRYPVYEGELDDIVGVLHVRDLFSALHERGLQGVEVRSILRDAIMVPETKPLDEPLAEFQRTSNHLAIVVDEYGSVEGLVTLEDLLEEIVGEIGDEFDLPDAGVVRIGRGRVRLVGSFPIEEFNERFGKHLPVDDYHTVAGFVFGELGRVPKVGDTVAFDGTRFEVFATDGPRIREVDVTLSGVTTVHPGPPQAAEEGR